MRAVGKELATIGGEIREAADGRRLPPGGSDSIGRLCVSPLR